MASKAYFIIENGNKLSVQFNPEEYKIDRAAKYSYTSRKENENSYVEFSGTEVPKLEIGFFFDTSGQVDAKGKVITEESDVSELVNSFSDLVNIKADLHRPPIVRFVWGSTSFAGVVEHVSTTYIMFNKSGMPIRAKVNSSLIGVSEDDAGKVPLESPDRTKSRTISDKLNIWDIAGKEYDDPGKWRIIAKANNIMDPFDIPAGTLIKVPALKL